ncbi:hypothetical protein UlMin_009162 [Ulmus minor]
MYHASEQGNNENYMIQRMETNMHLTGPFEQGETMYNEAPPEFVVEQGLYYPATTSYGYYCTGFESPGELEDHHRIFGVDGPDMQYTGAQNENLPYVYYTPTYGYAQSPYNPYNPYIPGAMIGVDGPFVGAQQYYSIPPYSNTVSSPAYVPVVVQPDMIPTSSPGTMFDTGSSISRPDGRGSKHNFDSAYGAFPYSTKPTSNSNNSFTMMAEGSRASVGSSKQATPNGSMATGNILPQPSSHVLQGRNSSSSNQAVDNPPNGKILSHRNQLKVALPGGNGLSDFGQYNNGQNTVAKLRPKLHIGRTLNDVNCGTDSSDGQTRGARVNRLKNELAVKAYTNKAGGTNAQGNIIIYTDQYNKEDFPVEYPDAKFFVIKSYSEDDVHKSIKYNVWSSTPHGNKKLSAAFEDAQRVAAGKPSGCPVFLFFSVNVSGQFCGVAEMVGPVDFTKDMDFWQQDKWSGSFPVKWHFIKDVPNTSLRHIILENNENKPVTNSRDTQEIMYKKGLEMLKVFKNHALKTSLLDDFMYYENRQKVVQEERARLLIRSYETPFFAPALGPPRRLNRVVELPPTKVENPNNLGYDPSSSKKTIVSSSDQVSFESNISSKDTRSKDSKQISVEPKNDASATSLKIGSLSIKPGADSVSPVASSTSAGGSTPLKFKGASESSTGIFTVGTIPLDPRALMFEKGGSIVKNGSQKR